LLGSALPIGAIALELGFEDAAYFSRLFHAKSGMSPQQYRLSFGQNAANNSTATRVG
jgi:transcriptional regulator GlxA family with amidase domain